MAKFRSLALLLSSVALLTACARMPDLDANVTPAARAAPYPKLVPVGPLLAEAQETRTARTTQAGLDARGAALRARAAQIQAAALQ
jgi:hypothetical protein